MWPTFGSRTAKEQNCPYIITTSLKGIVLPVCVVSLSLTLPFGAMTYRNVIS